MESERTSESRGTLPGIGTKTISVFVLVAFRRSARRPFSRKSLAGFYGCTIVPGCAKILDHRILLCFDISLNITERKRLSIKALELGKNGN